MLSKAAQNNTEARRICQGLWNSFDDVILPVASSGVALCVSGGADSRVLLEALARWPRRHAGSFWVFSVDHGTRSESRAEAAAVVARARILGFDAEVISLYPLLKSDEASLRERRYDAIWRAARCRKLGFICTAHHQGDDAEGFVMDLFGVGGGHEGSAMDPVRQTPQGGILRPLLGFSRKYLLQVLTILRATDYFTDPSNDAGLAKRSQVRHWLNDELQKFHPNPHLRLAHVAQRRALDLEALHSAASQLLEVSGDDRILVHVKKGTPDGLVLRALAQGLKRLAPEKDLRQTPKTLLKILHKVKKYRIDGGAALDPRPHSFTVGNDKTACFDLPGVCATIAYQRIWLQKTDISTFPVQNVEL